MEMTSLLSLMGGTIRRSLGRKENIYHRASAFWSAIFENAIGMVAINWSFWIWRMVITGGSDTHFFLFL